MNNRLFYIAADTEPLRHTRIFLEARGCKTTWSPVPDITHLLLPVPAFQPGGSLSGGGDLNSILENVPKNTIIIGGNLNSPALSDYATFDLLQDEIYLAQNAAITAECALRIATQALPITLQHTQVLILGWGRIGKCLGNLLKAIGADVTITARKDTDRAIAAALGYSTIHPRDLTPRLGRYRIIFNTVPAIVLTGAQSANCRPDCMKIDLASKPGIGGSDVIWARGLPGKMAPETTGQLIARRILDYCMKKEDII